MPDGYVFLGRHSMSFVDVVGIRIMPSDDELERSRVAWERERDEALRRYHELVRSNGSCVGLGDHTGELLPDFRSCLYPAQSHYSPQFRVFAPEPRRADESWLGSFVPDPSGRHDWRFATGSSLTQWVFDGDLWPVLQGKIRIAFQRHNVTEDEMGWYDDPLGRAAQRFFSGVEWTRWESDGTRAWPSGSAPENAIAIDEFAADLHLFLTYDPEGL